MRANLHENLFLVSLASIIVGQERDRRTDSIPVSRRSFFPFFPFFPFVCVPGLTAVRFLFQCADKVDCPTVGNDHGINQ